jgi:tetratricopeptide (TPR) repeat protein
LGHHLTNLGLHIAVTLLLFQFLREITGSFWRSVCVAALFALHPLHVESVAWASERKDVLSAFFFLLTLLAYTRYVQRKLDLSLVTGHSRFYILALALFALGLMSKPMVVTLPFVLLLLDFWPLGRIRLAISELKLRAPQLVIEKIPFLLLSIGASVATYAVQKHGGAVSSLHSYPLTSRISNIFVSYARYLFKTFWPANLTVIYPYQSHWPVGLIIASVLVITLASGYACVQARRFPYIFTGWFWFIGMLVPVIGIVQVGREAMAERYMYLPSIGLLVAVIWGARDLSLALGDRLHWHAPSALSAARFASAVAIVPTLAFCAALTFSQVKIWRNGETLFARAVSLYPHDADSLSSLGTALTASGHSQQALPLLTESVRLDPTIPDAQLNFATVLINLGRSEEAIVPLETLAKRFPTRTDVHMNLGCAYFHVGRMAEAEASFAKATALHPDDPQLHYNLSMALMRQSKFDPAMTELSAAVRLNPSYAINAAGLAPRDPILHYYLGTVLLMQSHDRQGIDELSLALRLDPNLREAHKNLGIVFKKLGQIDDSIRHFSETVRLSPESIDDRLNLAAALLDTGRTAEAIADLNASLALAPSNATVHCRLAEAQARNHESDQAIAHYREALRLSPGLPEAQHELAVLLNR